MKGNSLRSRAVESAIAGGLIPDESGPWPRLPPTLKLEKPLARDWILRKVGVAKGWGRRNHLTSKGVKGSKPPPSGGQRVVIKCFVSEHAQGARRSHQLELHLRYLMSDGASPSETPASFFSRDCEDIRARDIWNSWRADERHYRLMISPEHGDCLGDLRGYVKEVMSRVSGDVSQPGLEWVAACHFNTNHPHAHVVVRGRRDDGQALFILPKYLYHGVKARAQEVANAHLGDFSRGDEERRIWRETKAHRFTGLDRRLIQLASREGAIAPQSQSGPTWRALTSARLRALAALGLAVPRRTDYLIAPDLQEQLTRLAISKQKLRLMNQHSLAAGAAVRELTRGAVKGQVMGSALPDWRGAVGHVIVQDRRGDHHYARLAAGQPPVPLGSTIELVMGPRGAVLSSELDHYL